MAVFKQNDTPWHPHDALNQLLSAVGMDPAKGNFVSVTVVAKAGEMPRVIVEIAPSEAEATAVLGVISDLPLVVS